MTTEQDQQSRNWGMMCHLSALCMYLGIPFGNIVGPLLIWLVKKDEVPIVDEQGKESLNFQITMTLYLIAAGLLSIILIGIPVLIGLFIVQLVLTIVATVKASGSEEYHYPFTYKFIK